MIPTYNFLFLKNWAVVEGKYFLSNTVTALWRYIILVLACWGMPLVDDIIFESKRSRKNPKLFFIFQAWASSCGSASTPLRKSSSSGPCSLRPATCSTSFSVTNLFLMHWQSARSPHMRVTAWLSFPSKDVLTLPSSVAVAASQQVKTFEFDLQWWE